MSDIFNKTTLDDLNCAIAHATKNGFHLDHIDEKSVVFARTLDGLKCADALEYALQRCAGRNYMEVKEGHCRDCVFVVRFSFNQSPRLRAEWKLYDKDNYAILYSNGTFDESVLPIIDSKYAFETPDETVVELTTFDVIKDAVYNAIDDLDYYTHDLYTYGFSEAGVSGHIGYGAYCPRHKIFPSRFKEFPLEREMKGWLRYTAFDPYSENGSALIENSPNKLELEKAVKEWKNNAK